MVEVKRPKVKGHNIHKRETAASQLITKDLDEGGIITWMAMLCCDHAVWEHITTFRVISFNNLLVCATIFTIKK